MCIHLLHNVSYACINGESLGTRLGFVQNVISRRNLSRLNVEECGHEIRNEFNWFQKSCSSQSIIIMTQDRTSKVSVTYILLEII